MKLPALLLDVATNLDGLPERIKVIAEQMGVGRKSFRRCFVSAKSNESDRRLIRSGAIDARRQRVVSGAKYVHLTPLQPVLPITATGNLYDRIQRSERPPDDREIHINSRFNQLGGNNAAGLTRFKPSTNLRQLA